MYLFQNELPNNGLKSNKLDGSFFFYPKSTHQRIDFASCTTLSVLCKSFQRTLSINLAAPRQLKQASLRSTCTSFLYRLLPIGISLYLALTLSSKADAKVTLFLIPPKHSDNKFANKSSFNIRLQGIPYYIYSYQKLWFRPTA